MRDYTFGRKKAATSTFSHPPLVSPHTPTLANPVRGFGLPKNNVIQTQTPESAEQQAAQAADERSKLLRALEQPSSGHHISRYALRRPQAELTMAEPGDKYEQEADQVANQVMRMVVPDKPNADSVQPVEDTLQRKCTACEEEDERLLMRRTGSNVIQRDETNNLPPPTNDQQTPPLPQPPDTTTNPSPDPQIQAIALQQLEQQLIPETIQAALGQIDLSGLPISDNTPNPGDSTTSTTNLLATLSSTPTASSPIDESNGNLILRQPTPPTTSSPPATPDPNPPRNATTGDLLRAIIAVPEIKSGLTLLKTQASDRISQDWSRLNTGEQIGLVSTTVLIGAGALTGVFSNPEARRFALDKLNGQVLPVPGVNWLHLELNTGGDNLMLGMHLDIGRLLPSSLGFGPSSPSAIGGVPQPEPLPGQRMIQRQEDNAEVGAGEAIAQRIQAASGSGSKLDEGVQQHLEQHLGADLSNVQIHTNNEADQLSKSVNAIAFTTDQDIFFSSGSYNPTSTEGQHLIAHEVVHTVQQANGAVSGNPAGNGVSISDPSDQFEQEAEQVADRVIRQSQPIITSEVKVPIPIASQGYPTQILQREEQKEDFDTEQRRLINEAKTPGDVKDINPYAFRLASEDDKFRLIGILLNQGWVGPRDEYALEHIWGSFGKNLVSIASGKGWTLWNLCVERGASLYDLPDLLPLKDQFKADVIARAKGYLDDNKKFAQEEIKRLGLENPKANATPDQAKAIEETQKIAQKIQKADEAMLKLTTFVEVGYRGGSPGAFRQESENYPITNQRKDLVPMRFDPKKPPDMPPQKDEKVPMASWDETNKKYTNLQSTIDGFAKEHPIVYGLIRDNKIDEIAKTKDQTAIRQSMAESMQNVLQKIDETYPKLTPSEDFPLKLHPVHNQLFQSGKWQAALPQALAKQVVKDYEDAKFWKDIGLDGIQFALFVVAALATGGAAVFMLGVNAAVGAGRATMKWDEYLESRSAAQSNLSDKTALLSSGQASGELVDAILQTVFAFLDVYAVGSGAKAVLKEGEAAEKLLQAEAREAEQASKEVAEVAEKAPAKLKGEMKGEVKIEKTPTGETHELKLYDSGLCERCSGNCMEIAESLRLRLDKLRSVLPAESVARKQAGGLIGEARTLHQDAKAWSLLPEAEREAGKAGILERAKQLELKMAEAEKLALPELRTKTYAAIDKVEKLLQENPKLKGEWGEDLRQLKADYAESAKNVENSDVIADPDLRYITGEKLNELSGQAEKLEARINGLSLDKFDVKEFEKSLVNLPPGERVAKVGQKAEEVALAKGLEKDSRLSTLNNRDVYVDPATGDLYSVDTQHGRFERCDSRGTHKGEVDFNFEPTKPRDPKGRHDLYIR